MDWQPDDEVTTTKRALDAHFDEGYRNGFEDAKDYVCLALERAFEDAREDARVHKHPYVMGTGTPEEQLNAVEDFLLGGVNHAGHLQLLLMDGFYDAREGNWQGETQEEG